MFVVIVDFAIKAGFEDQFRVVMMEQAKNTLENETGCHCFDVCINPDSLQEIFLYERYIDSNAFDQHLASKHFQSFDAQVSPWIESKSVRLLSGVSM